MHIRFKDLQRNSLLAANREFSAENREYMALNREIFLRHQRTKRAGFFGPGPTSISARVRRRWRRTQDHVPDGSTPATWNPLGRHGRRAERPKPRSGRRQATAPGAGGKPHYFRW